MTDTALWDKARPDFIEVKEYRGPETEPDVALRGNPMAMIFPPPLSDLDLAARLTKFPVEKPAGFQRLSLQARLGWLEQITNFHYVFPQDLTFVHKVTSVVRATYRQRDPRNPLVQAKLAMLASCGIHIHIDRLTDSGGGNGLGLLLVGPTGVGISCLLDRLCAHLGDYGRVHGTLNGEPARWPQLGVIRVNVAGDWKGTLMSILRRINAQYGRVVHRIVSRESVPVMEQTVHDALGSGFAPLLVLDALDRLAGFTPKEAGRILDGMYDMMSMSGIPVVLAGSRRVKQLFEMFPKQMEQFNNGGVHEVWPLAEYDGDADTYVELLKTHEVSVTPVKYSAGFNEALTFHCMGVRRHMREYMRAGLTRHALDESLVLDAALLEDIARREMASYEPSLSILRRVGLGHRLSFAECARYEDSLSAAESAPQQTGPQMRSQIEWEGRTKGSGDPMSATEHRRLRAELLRAETEEARLQKEKAAEEAKRDAAQKSRQKPLARTKTAEGVAEKEMADLLKRLGNQPRDQGPGSPPSQGRASEGAGGGDFESSGPGQRQSETGDATSEARPGGAKAEDFSVKRAKSKKAGAQKEGRRARRPRRPHLPPGASADGQF